MHIALVGASRDPEKYGNKILKDLIKKGHIVYPINPKETKIEGIACFADIRNLPSDTEMITFVTPPAITLSILEISLQWKHVKIWCQPGASDECVTDFLEKNGFDYIANACVMIEKIVNEN